MTPRYDGQVGQSTCGKKPVTDPVKKRIAKGYEADFISDIESTTFAPGLNEGLTRRLSCIKNEPAWIPISVWRRQAYMICSCAVLVLKKFNLCGALVLPAS